MVSQLGFIVSVIIPVFNAKDYLKEAVDSVERLKEVGEVLLIDDASTDGSLEICQILQQMYQKVKVLSHADGSNHGVSNSRNLGIINARFEYVAFLDSDDYYLENRFNAEKEIFSSREDVDGVYGCNEAVFETEESKQKFLSHYKTARTSLVKELLPEDLFKALLYGGVGRFHTSAITVNKRVFEKVGLFNMNLRYAEDSELWLKLSLKTKLVPGNIQQPISIRRVHANNSIHDIDKALYFRKLMYQDLFDWGINQQFRFEIKNDLFIALHQFVKGSEYDVKKLFWQQIRRNPRILFSTFFIKKIHQIYLMT